MDNCAYLAPRAVGLSHDLIRQAGCDAAGDLIGSSMLPVTPGQTTPEAAFDALADYMETLGAFIVSLTTSAYLERAMTEGRCTLYQGGRMDILDLVDAGPISRLRDLAMVLGHAVLHTPRHATPVFIGLEDTSPAIEEAASWADGFLAILLPHVLSPKGQIINRQYVRAL